MSLKAEEALRLVVGVALLDSVANEAGKTELLQSVGAVTGADAAVFLTLAVRAFSAYAEAVGERADLSTTDVLRRLTLIAAGG